MRQWMHGRDLKVESERVIGCWERFSTVVTLYLALGIQVPSGRTLFQGCLAHKKLLLQGNLAHKKCCYRGTPLISNC